MSDNSGDLPRIGGRWQGEARTPMEVIYPLDGNAVALRPCPPWCTLTEHFTSDLEIHADDGYHHYGREIEVRTSDRRFADGPEWVVKVILKSWTCPLGGEPGPARIELQFATTDGDTDLFVDLTSDEARAVSSALAEIAAQHTSAQDHDHPESGG